MFKLKTIQQSWAATVLLLVAVLAYIAIPKIQAGRHLDSLFEKAQCNLNHFTSTQDCEQAVREIGKDKSARATEMLLVLANQTQLPILDSKTGVPLLTDSEIGKLAIFQLEDRSDPIIPIRLSTLIRRDVPLDTRESVSEYLANHKCEKECASNIRNYLDEIQAGKKNNEDEALEQSNMQASKDERVVSDIHQQQSKVYDNLELALGNKPVETFKKKIK